MGLSGKKRLPKYLANRRFLGAVPCEFIRLSARLKMGMKLSEEQVREYIEGRRKALKADICMSAFFASWYIVSQFHAVKFG